MVFVHGQCYNGLKWKEILIISLPYYKTIVDLCFAGHEVLLKGKRNHIDRQFALVNMKITF